MNFFKSKFRKLSIRDKILYSSILLIVLSFTTFNIVSYIGFSSLLEQNVSEYASINLNQANIRIEEKLNNIALMMDILSSDRAIQQVLKKPSKLKEPEEKYQDLLSLDKVYDSFHNYNTSTVALLIIGTNGETYRLGRTFDIDISNYQSSDWFLKARKLKGAIGWCGIRKSAFKNYGQDEYFLKLSRVLIDPATGEELGTILLEINENVIFDILKQIKINSDSDIYIIDNDGKLISHSDRSVLDEAYLSNSTLEGDFYEKSGDYFTKKNGENVLIVYFTSSLTNWKFVHSVPTRTLISQMGFVQRYNLLIALFACFITVIISFFVSRSIVKPLTKFKKVVETVNDENLDVQINISSEDEVGFLATAFNKMIERIRNLLIQIRIEENEKSEVEIRSLQNQINPHFIYNTLEAIRMVCEINDDEEAAKMLFLMGRLLRYGLNIKDSLSTIQDEIEHIKSYVLLMNYKYKDKFDVEYYIDESVCDAKIPKVTLQPIIENSIFHGLACVDYKGLIKVSVEKCDDEVIIEIVDNGEGFDVQSQNFFDKSTDEAKIETKEGSGIGLYNVNKRIKLYFGQEYGLTISSSIGEYTKAKINLPLCIEFI